MGGLAAVAGGLDVAQASVVWLCGVARWGALCAGVGINESVSRAARFSPLCF